MALYLLLAALAPFCALGASAGTQGLRTDVTPIQKVVQLLDDMKAKGKQEKHEEEVEFAKFQEWCDHTRKSTEKSIAEAAAQIMQLSADIAKAEADAEELGEEIEQLQGDIAQAEKELGEASEVREKDHGDYTGEHTDLSESIDAIERAIAVLKSREADVPQSLMQLKASALIPDEAKSAIDAFLTLGSQSSELGAPEANAYEFQSGGIVGVLEKLRHKFQDQRGVLEKEEMNSKSNFELLEQKLSDNIKESKKRAGQKSATKAQKLEDAAAAKGDLNTTSSGKAEDEQKLSDTLAACHAKSVEFEKNQVTRAGEVKAIEEAQKILLSDDVTGHAAKYLPAASFAQTGRGTALVQLRGGESPEESATRERIVELLQSKAKLTGSRYLSLAASHASADPFAKVKKMVKDLIVKLMEQANSEADHKAYCDAELATNKQTRENKQAEVDELTANIEKHESESAELAQELSELADGIAELRRQQAEATAMRKQEKATNNQTITDAKAAQVAVQKATKVLKEFYTKAADSSLLQGRGSTGLRAEMKQAAEAPYKGMQTESGGIFAFLEVILSDFARLEAETSAAEDQQAAAYQKFMDESNQDIAVKETTVGHKEEKKQQVDAETANLKKELELTQEELDAALAYYEKLKPDCVDLGLSYEERVRLREEEIQSLKEALNILNQEDLA